MTTTTMERKTEPQTTFAVVDCDIHPTLRGGLDNIRLHLASRWHEHHRRVWQRVVDHPRPLGSAPGNAGRDDRGDDGRLFDRSADPAAARLRTGDGVARAPADRGVHRHPMGELHRWRHRHRRRAEIRAARLDDRQRSPVVLPGLGAGCADGADRPQYRPLAHRPRPSASISPVSRCRCSCSAPAPRASAAASWSTTCG
jgi:hypothetical protein